MAKTELYFLIAVFLILTVILVWFGAKTILDMRRRNNEQRHHRNSRNQTL